MRMFVPIRFRRRTMLTRDRYRRLRIKFTITYVSSFDCLVCTLIFVQEHCIDCRAIDFVDCIDINDIDNDIELGDETSEFDDDDRVDERRVAADVERARRQSLPDSQRIAV